jgi:methionyl-tRNA formyltransferase
VIKYNYFFGSDERSVPFLSTLRQKIPELKVVTTHPNRRGRGRKIFKQPCGKFCKKIISIMSILTKI